MASTSRSRAVVAWSTGKDSAYALHEVRRAGGLEVVGLLTTITSAFGRVTMHGVREELLDLQIAELGLPAYKVPLPSPCPNDAYERAMAEAVAKLRGDGVTHLVFGDLFLSDVRAYREATLVGTGITPVFPLWMRDTRVLAHEIIDSGIRAILSCVDPKRLSREVAGRTFDRGLLAELPPRVDPCGERGEFHTVVVGGPMFRKPIDCQVGARVERDGFVFADVIPG